MRFWDKNVELLEQFFISLNFSNTSQSGLLFSESRK